MEHLGIFCVFIIISFYFSSQKILGISLYDSISRVDTVAGKIRIPRNLKVVLSIIGNDLGNIKSIQLTISKFSDAQNCENSRVSKTYQMKDCTISGHSCLMDYVHPDYLAGELILHLCAGIENTKDVTTWEHQGDDIVIQIKNEKAILPMWVLVCLCVVLLLFSGLFSGLNLGLMSITPGELRLIIATGTISERRNAKRILPIRSKGNVLLCSILIGNTLVNSGATIILDDLTSGILAVVLSSVIIVIFGEIIPQSICSRYGLSVGAHTRIFTWIVLVITSPLSFPLGMLLDKILGDETPTVYNRQQLLEMVRLNCEGNLEADEAGIIFGALKFKTKLVSEAMTPLNECFVINENAILDFKTISEIVKSGYSRIPVYSEDSSNIVALLHVRDLTFIDPDDLVPLVSVLKFYNHPLLKVFSDTTLDILLNEFKKGLGHLAIAIKVKYEENKDPRYEAVGLITLEDIIEEIIQTEISDETDKNNANTHRTDHLKQKKKAENRLIRFMEPITPDIPDLTQNFIFNICQFLSSSIKYFAEDYISSTILQKLITHPGVVTRYDGKKIPKYLFTKGVPADYFILILEGRVEVIFGEEEIVVKQGPFTYYGSPSLNDTITKSVSSDSPISQTKFIPDYSVKITENVLYLQVTKLFYDTARKTTKIEYERRTRGDEENVDLWQDMTTKITSKSQLYSINDISIDETEAVNPDVVLITNPNMNLIP